jgi:hypothetical protein
MAGELESFFFSLHWHQCPNKFWDLTHDPPSTAQIEEVHQQHYSTEFMVGVMRDYVIIYCGLFGGTETHNTGIYNDDLRLLLENVDGSSAYNKIMDASCCADALSEMIADMIGVPTGSGHGAGDLWSRNIEPWLWSLEE